MAERSVKRPAGVTRVLDDPTRPPGELLTSADLSAFTLTQLVRVAQDRGLDDTGTAADLRARILADLTADLGA